MSDIPQFGTAEYSERSGAERCKTCDQPISGQYYRVSGVITCSSCAQTTAGQLQRDTNVSYARAIFFGAGAALLGLILYSVVGIVTGLEIGYISLAVGYVVGRAIMMGSRGVGGRRYQIAAVVLTYGAVSMSAIPIAISQYSKQDASLSESANQSTAGPSTSEDEARMNVLGALGYLALIGLASPLLGLSEPISGLIGVFILLIGLRIAWQTTAEKKVPILGPFNL